MLFNSYEFLLAFLPLCLVGFFLLGGAGWTRAASLWLSVLSLGFYAWWNPDPTAPWNPKYLGIIVGSIVFNYLLGVRISAAIGRGARAPAKLALTCGVTVNLAVLAYYKYANFFADTLNAVTGTHFALGHIALPLAISFFTFTQIAYLVDSFHDVTKEDNFRCYLLFVSFFPHLIAGPIVLYRSLMPQFAKKETWRFNPDNFAAGLSLFAFGLFKKAVIADSLSPIANRAFGLVESGTALGVAAAWFGVFAYALQLYFDFSGYSDMAVGLGRMFNVSFPLNFDSPYKARDIVDFWRRWHITLSSFLRDHLYIPLGGNRLGGGRRYFNLFLTMLLGGLWHGAGWNFIIWGALHGTYLTVNHAWSRAVEKRPWAHTPPARLAGWALTFVAVLVGWVFFRAKTLPDALTLVAGMVGQHGLAGIFPGSMMDRLLVAGAAVLAFFAPNTQEIFRLAQVGKSADDTGPRHWQPSRGWAVASAAVLAAGLLQLSGVTEFLYFQF